MIKNMKFSYPAILWLDICVSVVSADSHIFLSTLVGSSVILPCEWRNMHIQTLYIEWCTISETVFERRGEESYQGERYKDRADVPHHMLLKGNCSLVLKEVRTDDAGVYESYLLVKQSKRVLHSERVFIQRVQLSVDEAPEEKLGERLAVKDHAGMNQPFPKIKLFFFLLFLLILK